MTTTATADEGVGVCPGLVWAGLPAAVMLAAAAEGVVWGRSLRLHPGRPETTSSPRRLAPCLPSQVLLRLVQLPIPQQERPVQALRRLSPSPLQEMEVGPRGTLQELALMAAPDTHRGGDGGGEAGIEGAAVMAAAATPAQSTVEPPPPLSPSAVYEEAATTTCCSPAANPAVVAVSCGTLTSAPEAAITSGATVERSVELSPPPSPKRGAGDRSGLTGAAALGKRTPCESTTPDVCRQYMSSMAVALLGISEGVTSSKRRRKAAAPLPSLVM